MKKLVLKTAGITLASIIAFIALLYGVFAIFIPRPLADLYYGTGSYSTGIKYYEKQYAKTGNISDLYTLCVKLDPDGDANRTKNYTLKFIENQKFEEFCDKLDSGKNNTVSASEFFEGKYLCALYEVKDIEQAFTEGKKIIERSGYTEYNCFNTLIVSKALGFTNSEIESLITSIQGLTVSSSEQVYLNADVALLSQLVSD